MAHFYEKQGAGANGLGVTDKFPWQGSFAPSGSWQGGMPNLGAQQQQPNIFQQQLAPSSKLADVDGIQQAMQKFKKMGNAMDNKESKFRNLMAKHAAQDNSEESRSAAGEGKGVTFKTNDDDHATGTAAWESIGQYMKKANEVFFVPDGVKLANQANVDEYIAGGMPARAAIKKAYPNWSGDQIDAFMSTYNKRAEDAKHDCDKEHPGISHEEWEEKDASDELYAFMSSIPQEKRASLAEFVKTSSTPGEAFELWMDKEGLDKKAAWEKLAVGWLARGALALGKGALRKIPQMWRGTATAAKNIVPHAKKTLGGVPKAFSNARNAKHVMSPAGYMTPGATTARGKLWQGAKGAYQHMKRNPFFGRAGGGTGMRGLMTAAPMTMLGMSMMDPFGGGGAAAGQPGGAFGGPGYGPGGAMMGGQGPIGYGTGGGQGVAPWQTHQQQPGHNPEGVASTMRDQPYKAACDSMGLTPYQLSFAIRVHEANLSPQQIEAGIDKAGEYMGEEYVEELREGMDKIASMDKEAWGQALKFLKPVAKPAWQGLKNLLKKAPASGAGANTSRVAHTANKLFQPGKTLATTTAKGKQIADKLKPLGLFGGQGGGKAMGAKGLLRMGMGAQTADSATADAPWYIKAPAIIGGAAFGRAMPRMGAGARAAGMRGMYGGFGGMAADETAGLAGIDTGGRFSQLGALGGFASPLLRGQKIPAALTKGKYNPLTKLTGKKLPNLGFSAAGRRGGLGAKLNQWGTKNPGITKGLQWGTMAPAAVGGAATLGSGIAGAADDYVNSKVEGAKDGVMNDLMSNPQIQNALNMAEQGGGFMDSLGGIGNMIDPLLEMMGMDPSQMNPLMKILLMAGGGLGLGGLLSGSKGAGIGGLGMMAVPLIAQMMKGKQQGGESVGHSPEGTVAAGEGLIDPNRIAAGLDPNTRYGEEGGLGDRTELEKAQGTHRE